MTIGLAQPKPRLTHDEAAFLRSHSIARRWVFDASPFWFDSRASCVRTMNDFTTFLMVGWREYDDSCVDHRHRLYNRDGRCVQCRPDKLDWLKRRLLKGFVYIASSQTGGLLKIGYTADWRLREWELSWHDRVADQTDWKIRSPFETMAAGVFETKLHRRLAHHNVPSTTNRYGVVRACNEVFGCAYRTARQHLNIERAENAALYLGLAINPS